MGRYDNLITGVGSNLPGSTPQHQPQRSGKYNAVQVKADGFTFDSKAEYKRYTDLKLLQQAGEIYGLVVHPEFLVKPAVQDGLRVKRAIMYEADFAYYEEGRLHVEDVKGNPTEAFKAKWRMAQDAHPSVDEWHIVNVNRRKG